MVSQLCNAYSKRQTRITFFSVTLSRIIWMKQVICLVKQPILLISLVPLQYVHLVPKNVPLYHSL